MEGKKKVSTSVNYLAAVWKVIVHSRKAQEVLVN